MNLHGAMLSSPRIDALWCRYQTFWRNKYPNGQSPIVQPARRRSAGLGRLDIATRPQGLLAALEKALTCGGYVQNVDILKRSQFRAGMYKQAPHNKLACRLV